ncbi:MAG: hypothetical protein ACTSXA_12970 [Candidatus Heimdallarchaeota archaeon]
MKRKLLVCFILQMILLLSVSNVVGSSLFLIRDNINDVTLYSDFSDSILETGDYHNEIDIVSGELVNESFILTLEDPPFEDYHHVYELIIYWDTNFIVDNSFGNFTVGRFSYFSNCMMTTITNQSDFILAESVDYSSITISSNTLIFPIDLYSMLSHPSSPDDFIVESFAMTGNHHEYFNDTLRLNTSIVAHGFNIAVTLAVLSTISFIFAVTRKYQKN